MSCASPSPRRASRLYPLLGGVARRAGVGSWNARTRKPTPPLTRHKEETCPPNSQVNAGHVSSFPPKRGWGEGEACRSRSAGFQPASGQDGRSPRKRGRPQGRGNGTGRGNPCGCPASYAAHVLEECGLPARKRPGWPLSQGAPEDTTVSQRPGIRGEGLSPSPLGRGYRKKRPLFGLIRRERPMNGSDGRPAHILPDERGPAWRQRIVNGAQYLIFPAHKSSKLPNDDSTSGGKRGGVFDFAVATLRPNGGG